jgi:hypothetical protein
MSSSEGRYSSDRSSSERSLTVYWIPIISLQVVVRTKESNGKVPKGNNSVITLESYGFCVLHFPLLCLTIIWICFEFQPVVFKLYAGQWKVTKGNNFVISQRVKVLVHCTSSQCAWPFMKLYWMPTISLKVMVRTKENNGKVLKGNNSEITLERVMVLVHCTSPYCAWPLYEVVLNSKQ